MGANEVMLALGAAHPTPVQVHKKKVNACWKTAHGVKCKDKQTLFPVKICLSVSFG